MGASGAPVGRSRVAADPPPAPLSVAGRTIHHVAIERRPDRDRSLASRADGVLLVVVVGVVAFVVVQVVSAVVGTILFLVKLAVVVVVVALVAKLVLRKH